jgi:single-strand DNA-binding protein
MSYTDINSVVLVGRLTRDPELRALASGKSVCSLRIACNGFRKDGDTYQERPNFFDVSVFGASGENADRYLRKGSRVAIDGRLEWSEWETSDRSSGSGQQKRQAVKVVAESVQFLDPPSGGGASGGGEDAGEDRALAEVGAGGGGGEDDLIF